MMSHDPFDEDAFLEDEDEFGADLGDAEDNGSSFQIPPKKYAMHVTDVVKKVSSAGNPMFEWDFMVTEGEYQGKTFKLWTVTTPAGLWKLSEVVVALGLGNKGEKIKFKKDEAIGRSALVNLKNTTYEGRKQNSITTIEPHPEGHEYARKSGAPMF